MTTAGLILKNARVITMDKRAPFARLVAVRGDRITLAGDDGDLDSVTGPGTRIIDCEGRTVVPGFIDAHCHVFSFLRKLLSLDLSPESVGSIRDIMESVREKAANTPPGEWITGTGYNDFSLAEKRHPTRREIDEAAPDHPVVLSHRSLHACVLNTRALELAGITRETEEPPGGHIGREPDTGEPDGLLLEMLGYIREQVMPRMSGAEMERGIELAGRHYLSQGITSLQDATVVNDYNRWLRFARFREKGLLKNRLYMMAGYEHMDEFRQAGLESGSGDSGLRLGNIKIVPSETGKRIHPPQEELDRMVGEIHRAGFRAAIHAVRSETVEAAASSIEKALAALPSSDRRHRIEHCSECPPGMPERLRKAGIVVATQPPFIYFSGDRYLATVPPERQPWLYRIKTMAEAGLTVAGSSDSPVVDDRPLTGIHSAVNRRTESGQPLLPEEGIPAMQALAMYTVNAAFASFEEKDKGTITPGKLADLAVLDRNPSAVPAEEIKDIRVVMTVLGGEIVWEG